MTMLAPVFRRLGVVVHEQGDNIDGLLADFALRLRERGFRVAGVVQGNNRCGEDSGRGCQDQVALFDLDSGVNRTVPREALGSHVPRVIPSSADLVVLGHFAAVSERIGGLAHIPLLTSVPGRCIGKWQRSICRAGSMLAPELSALWEWWGAERVYRDLVNGVAEDPVVRIVCGPRWIMIQGPRGVGLARLLSNPAEIMPRLTRLAKLGLRGLAGLVESWNPLEMAVAIAAINAHYNRYDLMGVAGNGVKMFRPMAEQVVVIGAFPGVEEILPGCRIIEASPRPGELPLVAMDSLLPGCAAAVVNSGALINRTLPRILALAKQRPVALSGPITPLTPRLFDYGPCLLSGLVVKDADGLAAAIRAGALPREFSRFGRVIHLRRDKPP